MSRIAISFGTYLCGLGALIWLSYRAVSAGTGARQLALWILLPVAWVVMFYPVVTAFGLLRRLRGMKRTLAALRTQLETGGPLEGKALDDVVEFWAEIAARDNRIPLPSARDTVRRIVMLLAERALPGADLSRARTPAAAESVPGADTRSSAPSRACS